MRVLAQLGVALAVFGVATAATVAGAAEAGEAGAPLSLYPRRPGAKYEDVEAAPGQTVQVPIYEPLFGTGPSDGVTMRLRRSTIEPESNVPRTWTRGESGDGFGPRPILDGPVVHLVVDVDVDSKAITTGVVSGLSCALTDSSDGANLPGFLPPTLTDPGSRASTTTTAKVQRPSASSLESFVPVGDRRGEMYARCSVSLLLGASANVVWRIDV
jgi:hypothetical protein